MLTALPQLDRLHLAGGLIDARGIIRALNPPCQRLLGLPYGETDALLGQPFARLFESMSAPLASQVIQFAETDGHWHGDLFFQSAGGGWQPVYLIVSRLAPIVREPDAPPIFLFLALDYTEQHYALTDQLRRQALLQKMWRDHPIGVIAIDKLGIIQQVNGAAQKLWEQIDAVIAENDSLESALQPLNETLKVAYQEALTSRQFRKLMDVPLAGPDGPLVHFEVIPQPRQGPLQFVLLFIEDRTEAIRMETRLRETERFASLGFMAATLAHEINNPLQSMQGALEVLRSRCAGLPLTSDRQASLDKALQRCFDDVTRIAHIIHPVRELARTHTPQLVEQPVAELLDQIIESLRLHRRLADISFLVDAPEAGDIDADPGLVQQILTNLIINAAQAMEGTGTITLRASADRNDPDTIHIQISDFGPGIDANRAKHLFTPFYTTKGQGEGTGLGLYTSRAIALQLGGWLDLVPAEPPGATFDLTLPRKYGASPPPDDRAWIPHSR